MLAPAAFATRPRETAEERHSDTANLYEHPR